MMTSDGKAVAKKGNVTVAAVVNDKQDVTVENIKFEGTVSGYSDMDSQLPFTHTAMTDAIGGKSGTYTAVFEFDIKNDTCNLKTLTEGSGASASS